jgi:hypothetical protein
MAYRYAKYPAMDRLIDVLHDNQLTGTAINFAQTGRRCYLSVLLPGHKFTDEYEGADIQAVAQRWLNGETGEDEHGNIVILALEALRNVKQAA